MRKRKPLHGYAAGERELSLKNASILQRNSLQSLLTKGRKLQTEKNKTATASGSQTAMASVRAQPWAALAADNLTTLAELTEANLLKAIGERYRARLIYTAVGDILVAVNPFEELAMYDGSWSKAYAATDVSGLAPHIFRVASAAYNAMVQGKKNQVCVISGESGAGKTESAKFIMKQVMDMCSSAGLGLKLQQKIIQLNPLLEAFGNASTELNDNSSRFGKFIQLLFEPNGRIVGAGLEQYLLEKSRVCVQAGKSPEQHRYLQTYCHLSRDCTSEDSSGAFTKVLESMESIGFSTAEVDQIVTLLAAILHIGDIEFVCSESEVGDSAVIKNPELVETVSKLLCLESSSELSFALTTLRTVTRGETVDKLYSCTKAAVVRDAAAKALYARMFQWIVSRINTHLQPRDSYSKTRQSAQEDHLNIGILDIFGFENFEANSFEQFCINLANEQLQQYFNHQIFAMEKMECAKEGVDDLDITYTDNTPVIELFLDRPIGLLCLLDEQCKGMNGSESAFVQRCRESFSKHQGFTPHRGNALEFTVHHYAGEVTYEIEGFMEKNKDPLPEPVVEALRLTSLQLLGALFAHSEGSSGAGSRADQLRKSFLRKSQRSVMRAMSQRRRKMSASPKKRQKVNHRKLLTVSAHFRESLHRLMERLFAASPHFVRCIKPNLQKQPKLFESEFVLRQLRYTGMLEAVRVRREGFSYRPFFSDFVNSYKTIAYAFTDEEVKLTEGSCQVILDKAGLTGWRLTHSRVFLRYYHEQKLQLLLKEMEDSTIIIQRMYRGYLARKRFKPLRERSREQQTQVASFLAQIAAHGQIHQPLLKALDRTDILEAPNRFKDRRKETHPPPTEVGPSTADYDGLSTLQRKAKKAQKFGVKVGALATPGALQVALKRQNSPLERGLSETESSRPTSQIEGSTRPPSFEGPSETRWSTRLASDSEVHLETEGSSRPPSVFDPPSENNLSRPPPPKYPPPSSKKAPVPLPTESYSLSPSTSPAHSAASTSSEGSPSLGPGSISPRRKRPPPRAGSKPPTSPRRNPPSRRPVESPSHSARPTNITVIPSTPEGAAKTVGGNSSQVVSGVLRSSPVPKPRRYRRNHSTGSSSSEPASPNLAQQRRLSESVLLSSSEFGGTPGEAAPQGKRPVGGVKSLPTKDDRSFDGREKKTAESSEFFQPQLSNLDTGTRRPQKREGHTHSGSNAHRGQEHVYSDVSAPPGNTHTAQRRALLAKRGDQESTLDFSSVKNSSESHTRLISNSVPDLLEDPATPTYATPTFHLQAPPTGNGSSFARSRGLAVSNNALFDGSPMDYYRAGVGLEGGGSGFTSRSTSQYSDMSAMSGGSGVDAPPQADKRKPKAWFGFRRVSRKKSDSNDSEKSPPLPLSSGRRESDTDVLGYYPHLLYDNALEMVSGQPRGTYVLFKEELREYSGQSSVFKLAVSSGREVKVYPILQMCGQYQLVNGAPDIHFGHQSLKSLVDHYKISELSDGLILRQPRLVAGVTVTGVNVGPRQPQMARKRGKKKH